MSAPQRRSKRNRGEKPEYSLLPEKTKKPKKTKKAKPKKSKKTKKTKKTTEPQNVILDVNEIAKMMADTPKKHKSKDPERNRKDHKKFYNLHFFEIQRKATIKRYQNGFRIRYETLQKYDIVDEYRKWKEALVKNGMTRFQEHLDALDVEIAITKRHNQNIEEYVNPTAKKVQNILQAQHIGNGINPENIHILINADKTPEVRKNKIVNLNQSWSQGGNAKITQTTNEVNAEIAAANANPQAINEASVVENRPAWKHLQPKKFTFKDVEKYFGNKITLTNEQIDGKYYFVKVKGTDEWELASKTTGKKNIRNIKVLMNMLGCVVGSNFKFQENTEGTIGQRRKNRVPGKLVPRVVPANELHPTKNLSNTEDNRRRTAKTYGAPSGNENLWECFAGTEEQVRQKVQIIKNAPLLDGSPNKNGNVDALGSITALFREKDNSDEHRNPFLRLVGKKQVAIWKKFMGEGINKRRSKKAVRKKTKKDISPPWKDIITILMKLRRDYLSKPKKSKSRAQANLRYVLWACYALMPPRRDNYGNVQIINNVQDFLQSEEEYNQQAEYDENNNIDKGGNLIKTKNELLNFYSLQDEMFIIQKYKTRSRYRQRRDKLNEINQPFGYGKLLAKIIKESVEEFPRKWLYGDVRVDKNTNQIKVIRRKPKKQTTNAEDVEDEITASKDIVKIQKEYKLNTGTNSYGVKVLRHSFCTFMYRIKKINMQQKIKLSYYMNHRQAEAENTYLDNLVDESTAANKLPNDFLNFAR